MANKADHTQLPQRNVLIFGGQNGRSAELKRILDRFFNKVYLAKEPNSKIQIVLFSVKERMK